MINNFWGFSTYTNGALNVEFSPAVRAVISTMMRSHRRDISANKKQENYTGDGLIS
jgi:hypothetical protein